MTKVRTKKISNYFWDDEIIGRDMDGCLHLKPGVKRRYYVLDETENNVSVINEFLIAEELRKSLLEGEESEDEI